MEWRNGITFMIGFFAVLVFWAYFG